MRKYIFLKNNDKNNSLGHLVARYREKSNIYEISEIGNRPDDNQGRIPHIPGVNPA